MQNESFILYDWFSVTAKHHSVGSLAELLGLELMYFKPAPSARGYQERAYFEGISIYSGGREEIWLEMSGKGCRAFESYGHGAWDTLFEEVLSDEENYHVTRLDVAFDDHEEILDLQRVFRDTDDALYVSKFKYWEICKSSQGITVYHGSPQSDVRFRIYDKAAERGRQDEGHWVRFEIQMRNDNALRFLQLGADQAVGDVFVSVINNYLRYVQPSGNDQRKRRWPMADYWADFIGAAGKLSLYVAPGVEYNLEKLERYAITQAGAAAAAYAEIFGEDIFLERCREKLLTTANPKYGELIQSTVHTKADENAAGILERIGDL